MTLFQKSYWGTCFPTLRRQCIKIQHMGFSNFVGRGCSAMKLRHMMYHELGLKTGVQLLGEPL